MPAPAVPPSPGRFTYLGVLALMALVFAAVVAVVTLQQRTGLRDYTLQAHAETLSAIVTMQLDSQAGELAMPLREVPGMLSFAVLKTANLRDVAGVRVFVDRQLHRGFPVAWPEDPPSDHDWAQLMNGAVVVRLHPTLRNEELRGYVPDAAEHSWIEAWVPLRQTGLPRPLGAAQFWIKSGTFSADRAEHDQRLWTQAIIAWLAGSAVIAAALAWAFRRLAAANRELRARTEDLQRANRELVFAAKTSALGAVTAHLIHELKNPLAGLEVLMTAQADSAGRAEPGGGELAAASELTRRLRTMVNDVVGVLRDEQAGTAFVLTCGDVAELVLAKVSSDARARGVTLEAGPMPDIPLAGRRANLATLVLRNLLQNAVEAAPAGGIVRLACQTAGGGMVEFRVEDEGPGLPAAVRERLFQPCTSSKVGGSGLGLALSQQLAQQAGGRLELARSDERGTCFRLVLPAEA